MREIRQKPEGREQRILHRTGRIPKSVIRDMAARSKEKAVDEMKSAPFGNRQEESSNTPANNAGEQIASSAKDAVKKGADLIPLISSKVRLGKITGSFRNITFRIIIRLSSPERCSSEFRRKSLGATVRNQLRRKRRKRTAAGSPANMPFPNG